MAAVSTVKLTSDQERIVELGNGKLFAEGNAATGKTTAAVLRIGRLLGQRKSARDITVIVPQPLLAWPYRAFETEERTVPGAEINITTFGSIARRAVGLFWPIVAETVGHQTVRNTPVFLNAEAAQMHLGRVIDPVIEQRRLFETVRLPRRRIYTQILDNINKSALVGFPLEEIGTRLSAAWSGTDEQTRMYDDVQTCASLFRSHCLEHGILDYSLTIDVFRQFIWPLDACRAWLTQTTRHLIYDNAEEDTPAAHDLVIDLIESSESALVLFDTDASYRRFLGADDVSAGRLAASCDDTFVMEEPVGGSADKAALIADFGLTFGRIAPDADASEDTLRDVEIRGFKYFPDMVEAVCDEVGRLIQDEGIDAGEIAIVTPYLSDALRFAFINRFERRGIPVRSLRPSRPLGGEPTARALLILAQLAYTGWGARITTQDVAQALSLSIDGLDPVRAYLLASTYRPSSGLQAYTALSAGLQARITPEAGERYDDLRQWLLDAGANTSQSLDHFFARLYGEILALSGYRFNGALDAANTAAALVRSAREHRRLSEELGEAMDASSYVQRVLDGIIGEQALSRPDRPADAAGVQVAPAYTFLMGNRAVTHQFWLDIGSSGWSERLHQPLGQPYVLNRSWPENRRWTAEHDALANAEFAYRLVAGLLRRCTGRIWLTHVDYNEQGFTQQGALLLALQRILRRRNVAEQGR